MLRDVLLKAGVAPGAIVEESRSKNTREQATAHRADAARGRRPALRARHLTRAHAAIAGRLPRRRFGAGCVGLAPPRSEASRRTAVVAAELGIPVALSDDALYNYAAWVYYWARGWTRSPQ